MKKKWMLLMLSAMLFLSLAGSVSQANEITDAIIIADETEMELAGEESVAHTDEEGISVENITEVAQEDISKDIPETASEDADIPLSVSTAVSGLGVESHTLEEIVAFIKSNGVGTDEFVTYKTEPVLTAPYSAGELSQESKDDALAMLNNVRYIAGLSADVIWDDTYEDMVQAGVLANAVNRVMSHYPTQPDDMSDELYKLGYTGCGKSNLGKGYISLTNAILIGWMADDDSDNIQSVGHRRWILNPSMGKTAFGKVGSYSGMYAIDRSNSAAQESAVAWPAQVMPLEYFSSSYPWSVTSLSVADTTAVKVVVRRERDGEEWSFSESSKDGDFYVGSSYVVFRPDGINLSDGDIYQVQITGLEEEITYSVSFFRLDNYWNASADNANTTDTTDSTNTSQTLTNCKVASLTNKSGGIVVKWNQVEGASGYYVYRKVSGGKYTRIATITDATIVRYVDADVKNENGTTYKYKVVPYSGSTKGTGTAKTIIRLTGTSLTSVKNSASGKIRVKWTAVSGVTGYQIQYSTNSSFASYKIRKITGAASVSKTLSSLTNGKTYYVRIRTYKIVNGKTYYSAWSSKLKITK